MAVQTTVALRTAAVILLLGVHLGCKTTKVQEPSGGQASEVAIQTTATSHPDTGWLAKFDLSESASQALYLQMLGAEFDAGEAIPKDQVHTNKGLLTCRKNIDRDGCSVWVHRKDGSLGPEHLVEQQIAKEVSSGARKSRKDIPEDILVVSDLECNYLGKNSPPFGVERAGCHVSYPRALDEVIFLGESAEAIIDAIRGESSLGEGQADLKGSLVCTLGDIAHRTACFTRTISGGGAQEKIVELRLDEALETAKVLHAAVGYRMKIKSVESPKESGRMEIKADIECRVDSSRFASDGERIIQCLGHI
jgi:hypothetical protein